MTYVYNVRFQRFFVKILHFLTSNYLQLLLLQLCKFHSLWLGLGLFQLLALMYLPSAIISSIAILIGIFYSFKSLYSTSPFFLRIHHIAILAFLNVIKICSEYLALTISTQFDIQNHAINVIAPYYIWNLISLIIIQQSMKVMCTPLFNKMLLKQKIDKKNWIFSSLCGLGIYFIHEFVSVKQQTSTSLQVDTVQDNLIYQEDFSDSWIMLIQTRQFNLFGDQSLTQNPEFYYQEILPLLFSILSGIIGPLQHILNMRFLLKEAFKRKLKLRLRNQIQILKESEVNLDALTKDQMLHPRKVLKNSQVFRRYVAVYEGFNKKEVVKQSQVRAQGQVLKTNGGILIPYKKANQLHTDEFQQDFCKKQTAKKQSIKNSSLKLIEQFD